MRDRKLDPILLLKDIRVRVKEPYWKNALRSDRPDAVHIAVLTEPYLGYILDGKKTIESRLSKNRAPPYKKIFRGDLVLLKRSGGPVVGAFEVAGVRSYDIKPGGLKKIKSTYGKAMCADQEFWRKKRDARFATLLKIKRPVSFRPLSITKRDRRSWIVLSGETDCP